MRTVTERNAKIKAEHPYIDNPVRAIAYCVDELESEAINFLEAWQHGDWIQLKQNYPRYLKRCK